jgi:YesN/AraC family two-component response regulator
VVRAGIRQIILERKDWEICGEATTGRQAVELALAAKPNVVIMDIAMPFLNGLEGGSPNS